METQLLCVLCSIVGLNTYIEGATTTGTYSWTHHITPTTNTTTLIEVEPLLDSEYCVEKQTCDSNGGANDGFPTKTCYCDSICVLTNECCPHFYPPDNDIPVLSKSMFECVSLKNVITYPGYGVTMVTKCDESWSNDQVKRYCESSEEFNETFVALPVTEPKHNILFRNMYCSICNYIYDFKFWSMSIKCNNVTEECFSEFQHPDHPTPKYRKCLLEPVQEICLNASHIPNIELLKENCENGPFSLVYKYPFIYRNKYCALCAGQTLFELNCETIEIQFVPYSPGAHYSFKLLVDFTSGTMTDSHGNIVPVNDKCKDNEMFDPIVNICREIFCPVPLKAIKGKCVYINNSGNSHVGFNFTHKENCSFVLLESSEYQFTNDSRVFVLSSNTIYENDQFIKSGSDVYVCLFTNHSCPRCTNSTVMFTFDAVESYLSIVTLIVSLVSLAITFFVYVFFQELLNTPGKILISLVLSLFLAQLMFLIAPQVEGSSESCRAVAVIMHYFFLAAFCWMNIVAFDLWITFSAHFISPGSGSVKRFLKFSIYGWLVPLVIVSAGLIVEYVDVDDDFRNLKPGYGEGVCWITSKSALLLFFAGPLAAFKLFDIIAFVFTSIHIIRAKRQGAMARQKTSVCSFLINLKLSLVMGLTWVFAFIANLAGLKVMWILFIVFNCLQGFFIAVSFLCTNKVKRLIRNKYDEVSKSKSSTQMTSLTPSKENNEKMTGNP